MRNEERKTNEPSLFKPRRVAAKIHSTMTNQFVFCCFNVENNDTIDLMEELKRDLKIEIIDL